MAKTGECTRDEAAEWGLLDLYPKKHTTWIKMTHAFEVLSETKLGECKYCLRSFADVARSGNARDLMQCTAAAADEAAQKRTQWRSTNSTWRGDRK